jgi:hypothetical protein
MYSFILQLINNTSDNHLSIIIFKSLIKLIPPLSSEISSKLSLDPPRNDILPLTASFFTSLKTLIRKFPDVLRPAIFGFADVFVTFMKDLNEFQGVHKETFTFLMETVADYPNEFFQSTKYPDFLSSFTRTPFDSNVTLLYHILHFMPQTGIDQFFASELFTSFVNHLLPSRDHPASLVLTTFIVDHLQKSNFKSVISTVWDINIFHYCSKPSTSQRINHRTLNFFRITWTILEQFPSSVEDFYNSEHHALLWKQLNDRSTTVRELKMFSYTLSVFNRHFTRINRNVTKWFTSKIVRLVESYENFPGFQVMFGWLNYDDNTDVCEDGVCRLIASFANITKEMAKEAFECLEKVNSALFAEVTIRIRPFIPKLVSDLCRSYMSLVNGTASKVRPILKRELRAVIRSGMIELKTLDPLANAILDIDPESLSEMEELINDLCLAVTGFDVFQSAVIQLVVAVGNRELVSNWIKHFWNLMVREIVEGMNGRDDEKVIRGAVSVVNCASDLIDVLTEKYELGVDAIVPHKEVLMAFREMLEGVEFDGSTIALRKVNDWIRKIDRTRHKFS